MKSAIELRRKAAECLDLAIETDDWTRAMLIKLATEFEDQALFAETRDARHHPSHELLDWIQKGAATHGPPASPDRAIALLPGLSRCAS